MSTISPATYQLRLSQYQRRESLTIWVAAGLGGVVILLGANVVQAAPDWLISLIITLVIFSGASLAITRVKFEWRATQIERMIKSGKVQPEDALPQGEEWEWPRSAEGWWTTALVSILLAGILMLIAAWWKPFSIWLC